MKTSFKRSALSVALTSLLALTSTLSTGCAIDAGGDKAEDRSAPKDPKVKKSMSREERERLCYLNGALDSPEAQDAFLTQVQGTWEHLPADSSEKFRKREFMIDRGRRLLAVTSYWHGGGKDVANITYRKICVGQPLDASFGAYAGFRSVEVLADNNEGGAMVLVKYDNSTTPPSLVVSDYNYDRYATDSVKDLRATVKTIENVWIYPVRQ